MSVLVVLALVALVVWLVRGGQGSGGRSPEPIDHDELRRAEAELADDPRPRSLGAGADEEEEDDWGPGTGR
ncbi:MAG: hypothetical protein SFV24_15540 [Gemmatimonadales bacterium]|nr:hypothetical protein [Gemmatimonadota bacterium]MCC7132767.1 hypothetical protein [Gemmatimonadales bacterium]MDX2059221.1 hypothetical protein [Gemmatimonadales bacterium]